MTRYCSSFASVRIVNLVCDPLVVLTEIQVRGNLELPLTRVGASNLLQMMNDWISTIQWDKYTARGFRNRDNFKQ